MLVDHPVWGRGKVLALSPPNVQVYFPSLATQEGGSVRLMRESVLTKSAVQSDPILDPITSLPKPGRPGAKRPAAPPTPAGHDLQKAIEWFSQEYPGRFSDPVLAREELDYKRSAHRLFVDRLGAGKGRALLEAGELAEAATLLTVLYQSTNIPSRFELMAVHDGLKSADAGGRLLDALLAFLEIPSAGTFTRLSDAVGSLTGPAGGSRVFTWPNVTILPFLADPSRFIVTKPEITKLVSRRIGFDLLYSASPKWDTYARVLEMSRRLLETLAPLGARDYIDVQSFVWVTRELD
jgi:hypothetical protein